MVIITQKELRPRDKTDHYPTPLELCRAVVEIIPGLNSPKPLILDPGAGTGIWGKAIKQNRWRYSELVGIEMDSAKLSNIEFYDAWFCQDYLTFDLRELIVQCDLILGNPPYGCNADGVKDRNLAEKFVRKSFELVKPEGYIVFLLRLGFLEGQRRAKHFWKRFPAKDVYVLSRRPSFTGNQRTDSTPYGVFVWQKGYTGPTYLKWLDWDYDEEGVR